MANYEQHLDNLSWPAAAVYGVRGQGQAQGRFVLVCEHASRFFPPQLADLGLGEAAKNSHAAWDIGALDLAKCLSVRLNAPLIAGAISRLVYDCNRPLEAPDCIPARSEVFEVPGNRDLDAQARQARFDQIHTPFHASVSEVLDRAGPQAVLVTVHSFTPIYNGAPRQTEIGFLSHDDDRLAQACLAQERARGQMRAALDEPYSATDGVTYSLQKHGVARGLLNVMIEVRNDLIDTPRKAQKVADQMAQTLTTALNEVAE